MTISPAQDKQCHEALPIDADEKVLSIYRHHAIAYVQPILTAVLVIILLMGLAVLVSSHTSFGGDPIVPVDYQRYVYGTAIVLSVVTALFTAMPVWLRMQEYLVLTDEAVLQVLQPALFSSKVSQIGLEHLSDVSVRQDFLGTIFGYGKLTIETPGEQDDYEYMYLPHPRDAAREITEAHENFAAALESGRLPTTMGTPPAAAASAIVPPEGKVAVDAQEYQAFLRFQQQGRQQPTEESNPATSEQQ